MTHCNRMKAILALTAFAIVGCAGDAAAEDLAKPLKVYILAGQSNMEGQGEIEAQDTVVDARFKMMQAITCANLQKTICFHTIRIKINQL